jgi:hypothetical protein
MAKMHLQDIHKIALNRCNLFEKMHLVGAKNDYICSIKNI